MTGFVFYEDVSRLDGNPIVGIVTLTTDNVKTGSMAQTWMLPRTGQNISQILASGADQSVCGSCSLRRNLGGGCYVLPFQAPGQILRKYHAGGYKPLTESVRKKRLVDEGIRLGAYGDPTAIPFSCWKDLIQGTRFHTGYTQNWKDPANQEYATLLMASVRSSTEAQEATQLGWRYYRMRRPGEPLLENELQCPAAVEVGHKTTCARCKLCDGLRGKKTSSISIEAHGHISTKVRALRSMEPQT